MCCFYLSERKKPARSRAQGHRKLPNYGGFFCSPATAAAITRIMKVCCTALPCRFCVFFTRVRSSERVSFGTGTAVLTVARISKGWSSKRPAIVGIFVLVHAIEQDFY